jgi:hypothetical protein
MSQSMNLLANWEEQMRFGRVLGACRISFQREYETVHTLNILRLVATIFTTDLQPPLC